VILPALQSTSNDASSTTTWDAPSGRRPARPNVHNICRLRPAPPLAVAAAERKTSAMAEPVVPSEYVDHVRAVTAELRALIPTVA
jgi:hypothetical protein